MKTNYSRLSVSCAILSLVLSPLFTPVKKQKYGRQVRKEDRTGKKNSELAGRQSMGQCTLAEIAFLTASVHDFATAETPLFVR